LLGFLGATSATSLEHGWISRVGNGHERLGYPSPIRLREPYRPHIASGDEKEKDVPEYQAIGGIAVDV
jgi:hypothetical protein